MTDMHIGKWKITVKDFAWCIFCLILVLCFFVGLFLYNRNAATAVLSGASTAVSIVLSIVAILYTMIEGDHSSQVNKDSQNKLESIDMHLKEVTDKLTELKELDKRIKYVGPKLDTIVQRIEQSSQSGDVPIDDDIKRNIEYLLTYINEDIDE